MFIRHLITTLAITTLLTTTAARVFMGAIAIFITVGIPVITTEDTIADTVNQLINTAARPAHGSAVFFEKMKNLSSATCFNVLRERTRFRIHCLIFRQSPNH
ncbi:hypothetical protein BK661_19155 [Pseudomonas frederiksbergensis]|jgi:hypothetical protein|uniref:Uncharacterized protein n=1 Tax=Pseudomonas frederiksbergensis TaxID=104087 RepID=A0A423IYU5_9PSED|nr:hypothetical protein BK661_19155 [Pseudomonas frederiksbergensis]